MDQLAIFRWWVLNGPWRHNFDFSTASSLIMRTHFMLNSTRWDYALFSWFLLVASACFPLLSIPTKLTPSSSFDDDDDATDKMKTSIEASWVLYVNWNETTFKSLQGNPEKDYCRIWTHTHEQFNYSYFVACLFFLPDRPPSSPLRLMSVVVVAVSFPNPKTGSNNRSSPQIALMGPLTSPPYTNLSNAHSPPKTSLLGGDVNRNQGY